MIDIRNNDEVIKIINAALNDGKTVEIKNESRKPGVENIVVVEINRIVKTRRKKD